MINKPSYTCIHCHKVYTREQAYLAHECKRMKRIKEVKTIEGQLALQYYQQWMRERNFVPPTSTAFIESSYYRTFMNFSVFCKKVNMPSPKKFIWYMCVKKYQPTMWMMNEVYTQYLIFMDSNVSPLSQATDSIKNILKYADTHNIDPCDIFTTINPNEMIQMVRNRQLSPWLLLLSKKFTKLWEDLNPEQQSILETLIPPDTWYEKLSEKTNELPQIKKYVLELGI